MRSGSSRLLALFVAGAALAACENGRAMDETASVPAAERAPAGALASAGPSAAAGAAGTAAAQAAASITVGHVLGDASAPVAVVEFSDFGCPYCARFFQTTFPQLRQEFVQPGTVRWRSVPVTFGFPGGQLMGAAAECAATLGGEEAFWRAHEMLYRRQTALRSEDARPRLLDWMADLGLDRAKLDHCIDAPETGATLAAYNAVAQEWYIRGTPSFLINGVPMSGALPTEFFRKVIATVLDPSGL